MVRFFSPSRVLVVAVLAVAACTDLPTEPANTSDMLVRGITLADWTADGYGTREA
jgi:hypothetical protein